jgi:hypothetical protein
MVRYALVSLVSTVLVGAIATTRSLAVARQSTT